MPYTYKGWILYKKDVKLKCDKIQTIYFFSKRTPKSGTKSELPQGYEVVVSERTGLPYLKKKEKCD